MRSFIVGFVVEASEVMTAGVTPGKEADGMGIHIEVVGTDITATGLASVV